MQQPTQPVSNKLSLWKMTLLCLATSGLYQINWFYRNWSHLKAHHNLNYSPLWRAFGLLIPVYGIILVYRQLSDIHQFAKNSAVEKTFSPVNTFWTWIIFLFVGRIYLFLAIFAFAPFVSVQEVLNEYWDIEQNGLPEQKGFTLTEIVWLLFGLGMWSLFLTDPVMRLLMFP